MEPLQLLSTNLLPISVLPGYKRDSDLIVGGTVRNAILVITIWCGVVVTNIVGIARWVLLDRDVVIRLKVREV
jgi:hypothetical protein